MAKWDGGRRRRTSDVGRYADATLLAAEAAEKATRVFGPKHPKTAVIDNLEGLYALSKNDKKKCAVIVLHGPPLSPARPPLPPPATPPNMTEVSSLAV
ncbi:hypothetical protein HK405_006972 [Cladochytrium tenue]|nr:hypothetical protein HK405_006972 [Cladochytrium tenue]